MPLPTVLRLLSLPILIQWLDALCLEALRLLFDNLPRAFKNGDDMEARSALLWLVPWLVSPLVTRKWELSTLWHIRWGQCLALIMA